MKILILCTGNSCRSQMAEAFLRSFDNALQVFSAGTEHEKEVNPKAIEVMREKGMDISNNKTKNVADFLEDEFDYVITVCDDANEKCPAFLGNVRYRTHMSFNDPAKAKGNDEEIINQYRDIRDKIKHQFYEFYNKTIKENG